MRALFTKLIDASDVAPNHPTLKLLLNDLANEFGFDCYAYLNVRPIGTYAVSTYPMEWQKRYLGRDYVRIDPIVSAARTRMGAFTWVSSDARRTAPKQIKAFYSEAADFRICSGVTIPIRTPFGHMSMLTLASSKPSLSLEEDIDQVAAVTAVTLLHARLAQQDVSPTASAQIGLTAKQALCLKWSAEGKTMKDIASIEDMSYATVNFHLNNARKALDASSLAQATALATKLKLI